MYSAFRMRALKPKKTGTRSGATKGDADSLLRHGGSVSIERSDQIHHVERLSQPKGKERGSGSKQRQLMQSASASNSICSQKTATNKEGKAGKG